MRRRARSIGFEHEVRWGRVLAALLLVTAPAFADVFPGAEELARRDAIQRELAQVRDVIARAGGWRAWNEVLAPCHEEILGRVAEAEAAGGQIFAGPGGSLFTTALTRFSLAHNAPPEDGGAVDVHAASACTAVLDLSRQLAARGIHVLFVPIPQKEEIYPQSLSALAPLDVPIYPQRYQYMEALLEAGVEVLDLFPALHAAAAGSNTPLYPDTDVHWGNRAMGIGAQRVAERLRRYGFVQEAERSLFSVEPFRVEEPGPLVKYFLPEAQWSRYPDLVDEGLRVMLPDGHPYAYDHFQEGPVLMIGDSFMMRSRPGGSWAARLAYEIGHSVTGYMESQKGAQSAARILARKGPAFLDSRRVVVWYVVGGMLSRTWFAQVLPE